MKNVHKYMALNEYFYELTCNFLTMEGWFSNIDIGKFSLIKVAEIPFDGWIRLCWQWAQIIIRG